MKNLLLFAAASGLLLACNDRKTNDVATDAAADQPSAGPGLVAEIETQCYQYTSAKDTVLLTLRTTGNAAEGRLRYQYAEKDRNQGTIKGNWHGDTLLADYTFQSEGQTSVREVAFLKKGVTLTEGYGEAVENGGKMRFNNVRQLDYSHSFPLTPTTCQ